MKSLDIICFGDNDWWYHNHGHMDIQMMKRYAKTGKILYVNSVMVRKFNIREGKMFFHRLGRKLRSIRQGLKPSGIENMTVYSPLTFPVHHIPVARGCNAMALRLQVYYCMRKLGIKNPVIWVACPGAAQAAIRLPHTKIVYQRTDLYEQLPGVDSEQIKRYDQLLKQNADLVIYVNRKLLLREQAQCKKAVFLDHGVDYELFAGADKDKYVPRQMEWIPHPVLGFYGNIDNHTFDLSLVEKVADLLKNISIVLIGTSSVDLAGLASRFNVYLLGQQPYSQIPHYGKCFDVCFMPWRQNEWIEACNPIKLKEYLALGKPVVSTPFAGLESYNGMVSVASDAESFAEAVRKACKENNAALVSARRKEVKDKTWDAKAEEAMRTLYETN